jgi:hypothetical protein
MLALTLALVLASIFAPIAASSGNQIDIEKLFRSVLNKSRTAFARQYNQRCRSPRAFPAIL